MKTRSVPIGVLLLGWTVCAQATTIYDVANDFSTTSNPNGVWSYGYYTSASDGNPATFTLYTVHGKALDNNGNPTELDAWKFNEDGWSNIIHNPTDSSITEFDVITWAPNALTLFSNDNSRGFAAARWTAPMAGTADVATTWMPVYPGVPLATEYAILGHAGTYSVLYTHTQWGFVEDTWGATGLTIAAGDTIDFAIVNQNVTQLDATIRFSPVPEPSACILMATGLLAYVWRRRK